MKHQTFPIILVALGLCLTKLRSFQRTATDDGPALVVQDTVKMYGQAAGGIVEARVPADRRIVVVRPGIDDGILDMVGRQVRVVLRAIERELQNDHTR